MSLPCVRKWQRKAAAHGDAGAHKVENWKIFSSSMLFCQKERTNNGNLLKHQSDALLLKRMPIETLAKWGGHKKDCCTQD
jgi:hypothetical protein